MQSALPASSSASSDAAPTVDTWVSRINADPREVEWLADQLLIDLLAVLQARERDAETPPQAYRALASAIVLSHLRNEARLLRGVEDVAYAAAPSRAELSAWLAEVLDEVDQRAIDDAVTEAAAKPRSIARTA